jgi:hypothetical protein
MSHVINSNQQYDLKQVINVTIVNYATGGEPFTSAELGMTSVGAVLFMLVDATQNSLGKLLVPMLIGGNVKLINTATGAEVVPTTALNATITAVVYGN